MSTIVKIISPVLLSAFSLLVTISVFAQKNVTAVTQTKSLSLPLPANSKQDKRILSVAAAKLLLEMESKKEGTEVSSVEVYLLPPVSNSGYNSDSLIQALTTAGYEIAGVEGDDKFAWAHKDNQTFLLYFSMDKKETNLYIGTCTVEPGIFQQVQQSTNTTSDQQDRSNFSKEKSLTCCAVQTTHLYSSKKKLEKNS